MERKYIFFGGKGGVGKTTCAAGYSLSLAQKGFRTLVVSTDPAHSLSDIFGKQIGSHEVELGLNLAGLEIDSQEESQKYMDRVKSNMSSSLSPIIMQEMERQIDAAYVSPGAEEAAIFDKLLEIIEETETTYDKVVFDTAPTGHTLRLLSLPELLESWIENLIYKRKQAQKFLTMGLSKKERTEDPVLNILIKRKEKFKKARDLLVDSQKMSFVFVITPEKLPLLETRKAIGVLDKNKISVGGIVINRILPGEEASTFWQNRKKIENEYLEQIEKEFGKRIITKIPLMDNDVSGDSLSSVASVFSDIVL